VRISDRPRLRRRGASASNIHPQFLVTPITGRYRLVWGDAVWNYDSSGPPWGDPVPLAARVSNGFDLIEP
jgi:hypothetical protein